MKIRCRSCGHSEPVNKELLLTVIGGAMAGAGFFAWTSFLFAGTGFAMPLCIAIVVGGPALVIKYGDQIVDFLVNKGYACKKCNDTNWMSISEEADLELNRYKIDEKSLKNTLNRSLAKVNLRASNSPFQQLNSFLDQIVSVYFYSVLLISENV
ncbi:hypothetical protein [Acinetobacter sp. CIP-A165]|uniref:hypothetical protein n=1 Tax=Acinetobacter sp. CIP-A165 TaxID=40373 RepID=UPI001BB0E2D2|nr:hypothetical protein [Acinetobacter sp. CIP-A165]